MRGRTAPTTEYRGDVLMKEVLVEAVSWDAYRGIVLVSFTEGMWKQTLLVGGIQL